MYPTFFDGFPHEPTATVIVRQRAKKRERTILSFRPSKALWRELGAVIANREAEAIGGPLTLRAIKEGQGCHLIVGALARDKASIVDIVESIFRLPARLSRPEGVAAYESEVNSAEGIANRLSWAVDGYRSTVDGGWEGRLKRSGRGKRELMVKLHRIAATHYWTTVETNLPLLMTHIEAIGTENSLPTRGVWRKMLFDSACDAYRTACGQETSRQFRAFAEGWKRLTNWKNEDTSGDEENEA